jgi:hypothetical protein
MKTTFIIAFFLMTFFAMSKTALACRCSSPETKIAYKEADTVIRATALEVIEKEKQKQTAKLRVKNVWKNDINSEIEVVAGGEICGHFFVKDQDYIIYLYKDDQGNFTTRNCVGNKFFNNPNLPERFRKFAQEDLNWLEKKGKEGKVIEGEQQTDLDKNVFSNFISSMLKFFSRFTSSS